VSGFKVVFVGEATNLCNSWCEAAAVLEMEIVQVCPEGYEVDDAWLASLSEDLPGRVSICRAPQEAVADADIIYTDCWPAPDRAHDHRAIENAFAPIQVSAAVLELAPSRCLFLPCPPVTRGEEVSADAMEDSRCRVVEAKAWLLHAQNALLAELLAPPEQAP
jgi:ornithine carbamoyltransferase